MIEKAVEPTITVTQIVSGDLWAGAEVQVYNLCKVLHASKEVAVTAVVFNPGILHDKLVEMGIPVTLVDESANNALSIVRAIATHSRAHKTQIIHTHGFKENVLGVLGKDIAKVPYSVRTVHGNPEHQFSLKKPHKWVTSRLDILLGRLRQQAVVAVSSQLEQSLKGLFPGKVYKIFNFVDLEEIQQSRLPSSSQLRTDENVLGIVGRLVPVKRMDLFIRTIALLQDQGHAIRGKVIGSGPLEEELKSLMKTLGIEDKIEFTGFVNPALREINQLDVLVMPSDHEGLPMTLLEAVSLGIPVVAHNVGGIPEVLAGWPRGGLVDEQSAPAYAKAVLSILSQASTSGTNSDQSPVDITHPPGFLDKFGSQKNSQRYIRLYISLMRKSA